MSEYEAVERAAQKFVDSVGSGDSTPAKELFYDEAVMFGYLDGKLEHGPIQNLYDNIDTVGADPGYRARIDVLCIEETVAKVMDEPSVTVRLPAAYQDGWRVESSGQGLQPELRHHKEGLRWRRG